MVKTQLERDLSINVLASILAEKLKFRGVTRLGLGLDLVLLTLSTIVES